MNEKLISWGLLFVPTGTLIFKNHYSDKEPDDYFISEKIAIDRGGSTIPEVGIFKYRHKPSVQQIIEDLNEQFKIYTQYDNPITFQQMLEMDFYDLYGKEQKTEFNETELEVIELHNRESDD